MTDCFFEDFSISLASQALQAILGKRSEKSGCTVSTGTPLHTASKYSSEICSALDNPKRALELSLAVFPNSSLPVLSK